MKCPMSFNNPNYPDGMECKKDDCAWWNDRCSIQDIAVAAMYPIAKEERGY